MTPEIHEQYGKLRLCTDAIAPILQLWEVEREAFEEKARIYANGTMDAVLPHFMSITEMRVSQKNLNNALKASKLLGELRALLVREEEAV